MDAEGWGTGKVLGQKSALRRLGQGEFLLDPLPFLQAPDQFQLFEDVGGLQGQPGQDLLIQTAEHVHGLPAVQVEDAPDRRPVAVAGDPLQGHAGHGSKPHVDDALLGGELLVDSLGHQQRLPLLGHLLDHGKAGFELTLEKLVAPLVHPHHVFELLSREGQQKSPFRAAHPQRRLQQLTQHPVRRKGPAPLILEVQDVGDLLQFRGVRHNGGKDRRKLQDRLLQVQGPVPGPLHPARVVELAGTGSHPDLVTDVQDPFPDTDPIDEGPVRAVQIDDLVGPVLLLQPGVPPRDVGVGQDDVRIGSAGR